MTNTWRKARLSDISVIRSGSTPPRANQQRYYADTGIPWVKTMDLNNGPILRTEEYITNEAIRETSCQVLPKGTVLVAMYGGFNQIGRTGLLSIDAATNQAISSIQLDNTIARPEFVLHWLNARVDDWKKIAASSRKDPNITREDVCNFQILLPFLDEQQKIIDILTTWDHAIDLTAQLIAAKQQYKFGLMQQMLTGKRRFARFTGPWQIVKIGDFLSESRISGSDGRTARKITVKLYGKGVIPQKERNTGSQATKYYQRRAGQFIYSKLDFLNGAFGIIPPEMDGYESTLDLPCFDFKGIVLPQFFLYFVSREYFYSKFIAAALGGRKARRIQVEEFLASEIKIPKLEEQEQIVACLSCYEHELALLNRKLALLKKQKQGLMQQLLTGKVRVKT